MRAVLHNRALMLYALVTAVALCLFALQFQTVRRLSVAEQALAPVSYPVEIRPLHTERVFSFPETTCGPTPVPVFQTVRAVARPAPRIARLVRQEFQYGLL